MPHQRTYDITVKGLTTLGNARNNLVINTGWYEVDFGTLVTGDCSDDNVVDMVDFSVFRSRFGSTNSQADLNGDGLVDIFDFSLLRMNFGRYGNIIVGE